MIGRRNLARRVEKNGFRWRGTEVSRLEALSDAVFGFAITLLVVSLEAPRTFAQLMEAMRGFGTFAACFALLFLVWLNQYRWFRRYGLEDGVTILLNALLLFVIVFFVYPLKFVFGLVVGQFMGGGYTTRLPDGSTVPIFTGAGQGATMMVVFGTGYVAVFVLFALMYWHAWARREELELDEVERYETLDNLREIVLNVAVGIASMLVAVYVSSQYAGLVYMAIAPLLTIHGFISGAGRKRLNRRLAAERAGATAD
ncbi:MAG TPA: TMEM175 family protein [Longimicrobiaceae bacterium]